MDVDAAVRPVDGKAIASATLAGAAVVLSHWWVFAAVLATCAIVAALASRRSLRADPRLRGVALSLGGLLVAAGTLTVIVGPSLVALGLFVMAPPLG